MVKLFKKVDYFDLVLTDTENMTSHYVGLCQNTKREFTKQIKIWNIDEKKYQKMDVLKCLYFALQFVAIYSMLIDFVSRSVYWQLTSLFTSCIGQLWNFARLNDVRGENRWRHDNCTTTWSDNVDRVTLISQFKVDMYTVSNTELNKVTISLFNCQVCIYMYHEIEDYCHLQ